MQIRTHMGVSVDGFVASTDGRPALLSMPDFVPGRSHGYPEFIERCEAVVMGRTTFDPAVGAPAWPWPGLRVYVLTSRPLPEDLPVPVASSPSAAGLLELMRRDGISGDVHLVGGPATIQAFREVGALHRLELVVLPILLGEGVPLAVPGAPLAAPGGAPLTGTGSPIARLGLESHRIFPDGSIELVYSLVE